MPFFVRDAGVWKTVNNLFVRDAGVWKPVVAAWVRDGGTWKQFFGGGGGGLGINVTGTTYTTRVGAGSVTGNTQTITLTGGTPPYGNYNCIWQSGDVFTINNPTTINPSFTTNLSSAQYKSGTYRFFGDDSVPNTVFQDRLIEFEAI